MTWNPVGGGSNLVHSSGQPCYHFPLHACKNPLRVDLGDVSYLPLLNCIEPTGIVVRDVELCTYGLPAGKAGGIGLLQAYYVMPLTVSFSGIAIEEVPCDQGMVNGYFQYALTSNLWTHTRDAGAGKWHNVAADNRVGGALARDEAAIDDEFLPITPNGVLTNDYSYGWLDGQMDWQVPLGWNTHGTKGDSAPFNTFDGTVQQFHIDRWGNTAVRKFGNQATRRIDDRRFLNGIEIHNNIVK